MKTLPEPWPVRHIPVLEIIGTSKLFGVVVTMLAVEEEELVECNNDLRFLVTSRAQDRCVDVLDIDVALLLR
ncbi:hypothetical protein G6F37_014192 [Rhizopus arrhizus]|nr:hypothetical protein G6F38_014072 [Rhizopus arrhizus]KAG1127571.1 hypothetical protein G6F37_014192 [Rhizopus arrhizus]